MKKENCWEFFDCGREIGGANADSLGVCPASTASEFKGKNSGDYAGRYCWRIAGTMCENGIRGTFAEKITECLECSFLEKVREEENSKFILL